MGNDKELTQTQISVDLTYANNTFDRINRTCKAMESKGETRTKEYETMSTLLPMARSIKDLLYEMNYLLEVVNNEDD